MGKEPVTTGLKADRPTRRLQPPMAALRAFDAVARLGGIRRAAQALNVDHSAVSRQIRALERWIGDALVERRGAGLELTQLGHSYHDAIGPALDAIAAATLDAAKTGRRHRLTVWSAPDFAAKWLAPRFSGFQDLHPEFDVELKPSERLPDFLNDEADVGIAYFPDGMVAKQARIAAIELCNPVVFPVATPAYLDRYPSVSSAADLLNHQLIYEANRSEWRRWFSANGVAAGPLKGPRLWRGHLTMQAALQDQGIALATAIIAGDEIAAGRLVAISAGATKFVLPSQGPYILLAREESWSDRPIASFRNWLLGTITSADVR